jgi:hypothetical protein
MDAETSKLTCAHPTCKCPVPLGVEYCSAQCANAGLDMDSCPCGHPECGPGAVKIA